MFWVAVSQPVIVAILAPPLPASVSTQYGRGDTGTYHTGTYHTGKNHTGTYHTGICTYHTGKYHTGTYH